MSSQDTQGAAIIAEAAMGKLPSVGSASRVALGTMTTMAPGREVSETVAEIESLQHGGFESHILA
jgi:hypothetical protein